MSLDLKKHSLRKTYVTFHGTVPINEHMGRAVEELEQWFGVRLYMAGSHLVPGWEVFGYGEKPLARKHDGEADDDDDEDQED